MEDKITKFDEILKRFSTGRELRFLKQLEKRGLEKMLDSEFNRHLGCHKQQKSRTDNVRTVLARKPFVPALRRLECKFIETVTSVSTLK